MSSRRKSAYIAVAVILGFWLLTKALNAISQSPGSQDYTTHCAKCHGKAGEGVGALVPPLANTDWLEENMDQVPCIIRHGIKDSLHINGVWYKEEMLGLEYLTDVQVYNITNYISKRFTVEQKFYAQEEVKALLEPCAH